MPGVTLHFVLADGVVDQWRRTKDPPPFDIDDPDHLNAFHHGAIGPDLGYFPGGDRFLSELSHTVRTGVLARTLVRTARTPRERAFAWGWLTHWLADRAIHPLVGRGVGEVLHGAPDVFVDGASDPLTHLRVELGLDCWYAARHRRARSIRLRPVFDETSIVYLQRAYALTYGVTIGVDAFLDSHRATGRRAAQSLSTLWIIGGLMRDRGWPLTLPGVRWALKRAYRSSALRGIALAYLNPVDPADWLLDEVAGRVAEHRERFLTLYRVGVDDLPDSNLDTGRLLDVEPTHPVTERSLRRLAELRRVGRASRPVRSLGGGIPSRAAAPVLAAATAGSAAGATLHEVEA